MYIWSETLTINVQFYHLTRHASRLFLRSGNYFTEENIKDIMHVTYLIPQRLVIKYSPLAVNIGEVISINFMR